jgi:hypothetical protein
MSDIEEEILVPPGDESFAARDLEIRRAAEREKRAASSTQESGVGGGGGERPPHRPSASDDGARRGQNDGADQQMNGDDAGRRSDAGDSARGAAGENAGTGVPPELLYMLTQSPLLQNIMSAEGMAPSQRAVLMEKAVETLLKGNSLSRANTTLRGQACSGQVAPQHVTLAPQTVPVLIPASSTSMRIDFGSETSSQSATHNSARGQQAENTRVAASEITPLSASRGVERSDADKRAIRSSTSDIRKFSGVPHEKVDTYIQEIQDLREEFDLDGAEVHRAVIKSTRDAARKCIDGMNRIDRFEPEKVFAKLRQRFGDSVSLQSFNTEKQSLKQKPFEPVREYFAVAEDLRLRMENFICETKGETEANRTRNMRNTEITSSFLAGLRPEFLQKIAGEEFDDLDTLYVRLIKIEKGLELIERAEEQRRTEVCVAASAPVVQVANATASFHRPNSSEQSGHGQQRFQRGTCYKCGSREHYANVCPQRREEHPCFMCGDQNHFAANCPTKSCYLCKQPGHWGRECILKTADSNPTQTESKNF